MTKKRFTDNGFEAIEEQSFTDNYTGKTYYVDYFDEIVDLLNALNEEIVNLKEENNKIKNILLDKEKDLECDYNRAAKAGMPTGGTIGELITIEDILEEMGLKK